MKLGVVFPQIEIGDDPIAVRDYAQAAESLGFDHLIAFDHVLGANPASRPGWRGAYSHEDMFYEPFVLFGYLAACTQTIELTTAIIILPQRQTALVAKQSSVVDVLSGGRLRLGVGLGWNEMEYDALGENFHNRGKRMDEQVEVMRKLWADPLVTYEGQWHRIEDAGLNPLPVNRDIPLWMGGEAEPVMRRCARLADGWFPRLKTGDDGRAAIEKFHGMVREAGRDPADFGIERWTYMADRAPGQWAEDIAAWDAVGGTHISLYTIRAGYNGPTEHIEAMRRYKEALG